MAAASAAPSVAPWVNLTGTIELLHQHLTAALCHTVFQRVRVRERQRRWTLAALAQFWVTVILTAPRALTQVLQGAGGLLASLAPAVETTPQAFFQRAERLRPQFFQALYEAFVAQVLPEAPVVYAATVQRLRECFAEVWVLMPRKSPGAAPEPPRRRPSPAAGPEHTAAPSLAVDIVRPHPEHP